MWEKKNHKPSEVFCYLCGEKGHISPKCPNKKKTNKTSNVQFQDPILTMQKYKNEEEQWHYHDKFCTMQTKKCREKQLLNKNESKAKSRI